jgi:hypothetical protein
VRNQEDTIKEWQETRKTQDFDSAVQEQKQLPHKIKSLLATKRIQLTTPAKPKQKEGLEASAGDEMFTRKKIGQQRHVTEVQDLRPATGANQTEQKSCIHSD